MLQCQWCQKRYSEEEKPWKCSCGGPLLLEVDQTSFPSPELLASRSHSLWRYEEALPLNKNTNPVTFGEGMTPLVLLEWEGFPIFFKLDYVCPSGSYKDRGIAYEMTKLKELGISSIIEDSSGNAGAAMAAYAARAGIHCQIFVPGYTSAGKCVQIESYGAELVRVPGSREDTTKAAEQAANDIYYASHNWSPYFVHGVKTYAFEVWEQLGYEIPDKIIVPAGQGSLVIGCYLAFQHLYEAGRIERLPQIIAVQAKKCAPLYEAFIQGKNEPVSIYKEETIAEGISSSQPVRGREVLDAIKKTEGIIMAVDDNEIEKAFYALARAGFYVEPTSAVVGAALWRLQQQEKLSRGEKTVAFLSGSGLKATDKILHLREE